MDLKIGDTQLIIATARAENLLRNELAYALATTYHETAFTMKPVRETLAKNDAEAIRILDKSWSAKKLPWVKIPYWRYDDAGRSWLGRGYVQLTWYVNYLAMTRRLGVDLMTDPNAALRPDVAARILIIGMKEGTFTGKRLSDYITLKKSDFKSARRIINGTDKDDQIAAYARAYDAALTTAGYGVDPALPVKIEHQKPAACLFGPFLPSSWQKIWTR
jgi:predicted chitinase